MICYGDGNTQHQVVFLCLAWHFWVAESLSGREMQRWTVTLLKFQLMKLYVMYECSKGVLRVRRSCTGMDAFEEPLPHHLRQLQTSGIILSNANNIIHWQIFKCHQQLGLYTCLHLTKIHNLALTFFKRKKERSFWTGILWFARMWINCWCERKTAVVCDTFMYQKGVSNFKCQAAWLCVSNINVVFWRTLKQTLTGWWSVHGNWATARQNKKFALEFIVLMTTSSTEVRTHLQRPTSSPIPIAYLLQESSFESMIYFNWIHCSQCYDSFYHRFCSFTII